MEHSNDAHSNDPAVNNEEEAACGVAPNLDDVVDLNGLAGDEHDDAAVSLKLISVFAQKKDKFTEASISDFLRAFISQFNINLNAGDVLLQQIHNRMKEKAQAPKIFEKDPDERQWMYDKDDNVRHVKYGGYHLRPGLKDGCYLTMSDKICIIEKIIKTPSNGVALRVKFLEVLKPLFEQPLNAGTYFNMYTSDVNIHTAVVDLKENVKFKLFPIHQKDSVYGFIPILPSIKP
jgi:hypothetical protein